MDNRKRRILLRLAEIDVMKQARRFRDGSHHPPKFSNPYLASHVEEWAKRSRPWRIDPARVRDQCREGVEQAVEITVFPFPEIQAAAQFGAQIIARRRPALGDLKKALEERVLVEAIAEPDPPERVVDVGRVPVL